MTEIHFPSGTSGPGKSLTAGWLARLSSTRAWLPSHENCARQTSAWSLLVALIPFAMGQPIAAQGVSPEDSPTTPQAATQQETEESDDLSSDATSSMLALLGDGTDEEKREYGSRSTVIETHGFMNFRYLNGEGMDSDLDLHHANLFFGADLGESVQAWLEIEYEHSGEEIELDQAEIRVHWGDTLLGFGRFYAPFGIERHTWYPTERATESRPDVYRYVVPGNWYETGARVHRTWEIGASKLQTELAITDGLGSNANTDIRGARQTRDANNSKAIIGRVGLAASDSFAVGVSGATMEYTVDDTLYFFGFDVEYDAGPLLLRAELVHSGVEDSGSGDFDREGLYVLAAYELDIITDQAVRVSGRFDILDGNDSVVDAMDFSAYTAAVGWSPQQNLWFKGEVRSFSGRHGSTPTSDYEVALSVSVSF